MTLWLSSLFIQKQLLFLGHPCISLREDWLWVLSSFEKLLHFSLFFFIDTYEPDGYNPEAPSITSAGRSQYRQFFTRAQTQRPNLIGLTSGEMDTNPRGRKGFYFSLRTSVFIFPFSRLKAMFFLTDLVFQSSFQTSEILWHLYFFFLFFFFLNV